MSATFAKIDKHPVHIERKARLYLVPAFSALAISLIGISLSRLVYPYDVGYYEACVWEPARLAADGLNPYNYATRPPFVMAPYGYLYYLVIGLGLKLFGLQLWFGRLMSVFAAVIIAICIWRISMSFTEQRQAAALAFIVFLSSITLQSWIAVQRPDLLGLSLAGAGLTLVFCDGVKSDNTGSRSLLAAALFAGAFFCKQTFVLPALVAFARYLQVDRKKQAFLALATMIGLCVLVTGLLNARARRTSLATFSARQRNSIQLFLIGSHVDGIA